MNNLGQSTKDEQRFMEAVGDAGVLMALHISFWRAYTQLKPQDIGISPDRMKSAGNLISLGRKKLIPSDRLREFNLIESRARSLVDSNTFPFLGGVARFLPNKKLLEVNRELERFKLEFEELARKFTTEYEEIREDALSRWRVGASKILDDEEAIEELLRAVENAFPTSTDLLGKYRFEISMFQIKHPGIPREEALDLADREEIIAARNEAARKAAEEIESSCRGFVKDCMVSMRTELRTLIDEMMESIRNSKSGVHQKTLNRLSSFASRFRELNFAGDTEFERFVSQVESEITTKTAEEYREDDSSIEALTGRLSEIKGMVNNMLSEDLDNELSSFGSLGGRKLSL